MKPKLIVALDVPTADDIPTVVRSLPPEITHYKVGLELFTSEGPAVLEFLNSEKKRIFLDLKLHDIPRTVARAVTAAARHNVALLSIHAGGGSDMLRAASEAAKQLGEHAPQLLAITTLTSLNQADLDELGVSRPLPAHTLALAKMAVSCGIDGLVCSVHEVSQLREALRDRPAYNAGTDPDIGDRPLLVTPGIRLAGTDLCDQKRVATPEMAVKGGASFLVVGRPILKAPDPASAAREILRQIDAATETA